MINIMLVCSSGVSTSMLVNRIQDAGVKSGKEVHVWAVGNASVYDEFSKANVILIGPQMRFRRKDIEEIVQGTCKVDVIDMLAYGTMDGEAVLKQALKLLA